MICGCFSRLNQPILLWQSCMYRCLLTPKVDYKLSINLTSYIKLQQWSCHISSKDKVVFAGHSDKGNKHRLSCQFYKSQPSRLTWGSLFQNIFQYSMNLRWLVIGVALVT